MDIDFLIRERADRDAFLAEHYASPIPEEHRAAFGGLEYFPPDQAWEIKGHFEPTDPHKVSIPSTTGTESPYTMVGLAVLRIGGDSYRLMVLDDGDGGMFVPFRDATSGLESYGGGRYVRIEPQRDGSVTVDFNAAKNPWCVYDEEFVCPLPPAGNWISEPIPAGEKMYEAPTGR
jgi:uncharacterized protein